MFDELMRAAIERDTAAREIFASLSAKEPMGHAEVCEALLAAVQTTTFASGASTDRTVVKDSPMTHRHIMSEPYVREFVCNKYDGRLADYEDFVALHNQLVEQALDSQVSVRALAMIPARSIPDSVRRFHLELHFR